MAMSKFVYEVNEYVSVVPTVIDNFAARFGLMDGIWVQGGCIHGGHMARRG